MTFGEKLKEAGYSQEQFAEKMNVSRSAVAKWETDYYIMNGFSQNAYFMMATEIFSV